MLDKEEWFSEMIVIKRSGDLEETLYDESVNWEDDPEEDPTAHYEFHTEVQLQNRQMQRQETPPRIREKHSFHS